MVRNQTNDKLNLSKFDSLVSNFFSLKSLVLCTSLKLLGNSPSSTGLFNQVSFHIGQCLGLSLPLPDLGIFFMGAHYVIHLSCCSPLLLPQVQSKKEGTEDDNGSGRAGGDGGAAGGRGRVQPFHSWSLCVCTHYCMFSLVVSDICL
jgi:hypothetical protein